MVNKIYCEQDYQGESALFKFYYHDSMENEPKNIFTIVVSPKIITDEGKNITNKTPIVLAENYDNTFVLQENDADLLNSLNITTEALMDYFSLVY